MFKNNVIIFNKLSNSIGVLLNLLDILIHFSYCLHFNFIVYFLLTALKNRCRIKLPIACVPVNNMQRTIRHYCQGPIHKEMMVPVTANHDEHQYEENVKKQILAKALDYVPKTGWSVESLTQGAEALGYPGITHGLFPNGGGDLVHYFNVTCNERLVGEMKNWPKEELKQSQVPRQLIENAIIARLIMIDPYKSTWPKAMAIQTLPHNVPNCLATLLSLVDDICYHTGDRSVDFNWYIRRVGLAGIYKASELFYLTDSSQGSSGTRSFVKSRIRDAEFIQLALKMNPITVAPQTLTAAFVTTGLLVVISISCCPLTCLHEKRLQIHTSMPATYILRSSTQCIRDNAKNILGINTLK